MAEYIALHKDNPLVVPCTAGYQCSSGGYSTRLFSKMLELVGASERFLMSSVQYLPVVRIDSGEELRAVMEELSPYADFDFSYPDTISFHDAVKAYDDSFFETSTLFLVCTSAPMTDVRHVVEYVELSNGTLSIGLQRLYPETGGDAIESWLIAVSVPTRQIAGAEEIEARISSIYYPDGEKVLTADRDHG